MQVDDTVTVLSKSFFRRQNALLDNSVNKLEETAKANHELSPHDRSVDIVELQETADAANDELPSLNIVELQKAKDVLPSHDESELKLQEKPKCIRKRRSTGSHLESPSEFIISDDKFSLIKKRRSSSRPPPTIPSRKPKKTNKTNGIDGKTLSTETITENNEPPIDYRLSLEKIVEQQIPMQCKVSVEPIKISFSLSDISLPDVKAEVETSKIIDITELTIEHMNATEATEQETTTDEEPINAEIDTTENHPDDPLKLSINVNLLAFSPFQELNVEQSNDDFIPTLQFPDPLSNKNQFQLQESQEQNNMLEDVNLINEFDLSLFPQLDNVVDEVIIETSMTEDLSNKSTANVSESSKPEPLDYAKQFGIKNSSVVLELLDAEKIKKIVGNRMPELPKVTKSGRVLKPKVIADAVAGGTKRKSTQLLKQQLKQMKLEMKLLAKAAKKEKPRKNSKATNGTKIRLTKKGQKTKNPKESQIAASNDSILVYPDDDFPDSFEIEESYVDYTIGESSLSLTNLLDL